MTVTPEYILAMKFAAEVFRIILIIGLLAFLVSAFTRGKIRHVALKITQGIFLSDETLPSTVINKTWRIISVGTSTAFLSILAIYIWATDTSATVIVIAFTGIAFALSVLLDSIYDDGGIFGLAACVLVAQVVPATLAAIAAGIPKEMIIPAVLSVSLIFPLAFLTALLIAREIIRFVVRSFSVITNDKELRNVYEAEQAEPQSEKAAG